MANFINWPLFKEAVYKKLIYFINEDITKIMKNRLEFHKSMLFPELEIHDTFCSPQQG